MWLTTTPGDVIYDAAHPHPFLSLLEQYADAVGHAPPMPAFAAGFIASKDRYRNQSQLLDVAHGYVDRGIPISMIVIDCASEAVCARRASAGLACPPRVCRHHHPSTSRPRLLPSPAIRQGSTGRIWAT